MNAEPAMKPYVIGLDLGGTNSVFGIVDSRGDIKVTTAIKTQGYKNVEDYVKASVDALKVIIDQVGGIEKIKAMGIGAPNGNYYNGTIEFAPNLEWGHDGVVPLADMFSKALGIPVALICGISFQNKGRLCAGRQERFPSLPRNPPEQRLFRRFGLAPMARPL